MKNHAGRRTPISRWRSIMGKLQYRLNREAAIEKEKLRKKVK